jgi:hypothetical protein
VLSFSARMTAVAVLVAALAGCGSAGGSSGGSAGVSTVSPAAYVHSLCGAIYPWERDVVVSGVKLQEGLGLVKTPPQAKLLLQAYITTVSSDTDTAVTRLRSAGTPAVKNGSAIQGQVLGAFSQLSSAYHQALVQVNALPTASRSDFRTGIGRLQILLSSVGGISQRLKSGPLTSPELHKAAARDPACRGA